MGHRAGAVIGSREKDNVAGLCLGGGNDSALVINALRRGTGQVVDAAGRVHPADKARTVKGGGGAGAAPHIGPADVLCGFFHECRKSRVIQRLAGYLIAGAGIFAAVVNPFPQIGLVAFELLHNGVDFPLLFVKPRQDHGGQRFVCEGHIENVILIGDFLGGGFSCLRVGAGFGAVAYLDLNFVLADEINRAPAKVQSALLEAMQERQVTIGKETFILPEPFLVLATQNPIEQEGTYPLPEAQVDRFMLKVVIDYPKLEEEKLIIRQNINGEKFNVKPILKADEIIEARKVVRQVYLDEKIERYIVDIVFATRFPEKYDLKELKDMIGFGGSPRASINLALAARTYAFIKRRGYVIPEDVRAVAHDVLRHRIGLTYEAEANNMTSDEIISKILNKVEVP